MINVRAFILGYYPICGFLAWAEGDREALFVDPGGWSDEIPATLEELGLTIAAIALTHGHDDHIGGLEEMVAYTGAPVYAHAGEFARLSRRPDVVLQDEESISCGSLAWRVLHVPGHTPGSVAYAAGAVAFTGDTLFAGSIGGTANLAAYEQERAAIRAKILTLGDATRLYPAHGPATTVGTEWRSNPFLR